MVEMKRECPTRRRRCGLMKTLTHTHTHPFQAHGHTFDSDNTTPDKCSEWNVYVRVERATSQKNLRQDFEHKSWLYYLEMREGNPYRNSMVALRFVRMPTVCMGVCVWRGGGGGSSWGRGACNEC